MFIMDESWLIRTDGSWIEMEYDAICLHDLSLEKQPIK